jgi:UDP:flavonoid glycosyltransferase YjiC (YdhE family)
MLGKAPVWDADCLFANIGFLDETFIHRMTALHIQVVRDYKPEIVVDCFSPYACLAARICGKPLVTVIQGDFHPAGPGFSWWEEHRPDDLPNPAPVLSRVAHEFGWKPVTRVVDLFAGDLVLIPGTPETDPLPSTANVTYVGPLFWERDTDALPEAIALPQHDGPMVWLYPGNPRYGLLPSFGDSLALLQGAVEAFADSPMQIVLTTGHQDLPPQLRKLPDTFTLSSFLPGMAMARRSDLMIHHGGHGSVMTGLRAGTPQVIVPTYAERESNARRMAALGAGEFVVPAVSESGKKRVDIAELKAKVTRVLSEPRYRDSARRFAEYVRSYGGAHEAADRIESFAAAIA